MTDHTQQTINDIFLENRGRVLASLISTLGDFDLAEDVLQDAFIVALKHWQDNGIPPNPIGWITLTARRKALDRLRRDKTFERKLTALQKLEELEQETQTMDEVGVIQDERLKLIFTCCHPALARDSQIALTLRTLGGLSTVEIARSFFTPVPTMAQRLVRVKRKIKKANIPYRVPPPHLLGDRLDNVLEVIYLIFNAGYTAYVGDELVRHDLCTEAIRLGRVLVKLLAEHPQLEQSPEAMGLLALMLLSDARRDSRVRDGKLVLLEDQDRTLWNQEAISEGAVFLEHALHMGYPARYQFEAAISAIHCEAQSYEETDWRQIAAIYGRYVKLYPSPLLELNWIVAIAMVDGAEVGLNLLAQIADNAIFVDYVTFYATRADLLRRAGRLIDALPDYQRALQLSDNGVQKDYFQQKITEIDSI